MKRIGTNLSPCRSQRANIETANQTGRTSSSHRAEQTGCAEIIPSRSETSRSVVEQLEELCLDVDRYCVSNPQVAGTERFLKRSRQELRVAKLLQGEESQDDGLLREKVQGSLNNLNGLKCELQTAKEAPGTVAIGARFSYLREQRANKTSVEVDVVALCGQAWIEVKHLGSSKQGSGWFDSPGHCKGVHLQAMELVRAANAVENKILWKAPTVVFRFINGKVDQEVTQKLQSVGVVVVDDSFTQPFCQALPPQLPPPISVNLDIT
ncbi:hypothetical protein CYMTET_22612, partial [Cymbomonas tetramitiformis]